MYQRLGFIRAVVSGKIRIQPKAFIKTVRRVCFDRKGAGMRKRGNEDTRI